MKIGNVMCTVLAGLICLSSCQKEKLDVWTEKGRVWFGSVTDTVASFKKYPAETQEILMRVPIYLAGRLVDRDREVNVRVVKDKRNSQTQYEIQRPVLVKAGETRGFLTLKIVKTPNLALLADTLNLGIISSQDLEAGLRLNLERVVIISNKYNKPWWWYDFRMGIWSEAKHQTLIDALGSDDDVRGPDSQTSITRGWTGATALYNIYLLNKYCEEHGLSYRFTDGR